MKYLSINALIFLSLITTLYGSSESPACNLHHLKVNTQGQYCNFPGITVVSSVGTRNSELWAKIYEGLNKSSLIKSYYALLPLTSYHMTTLNLFTKKGTSRNWNSFMENRLPWFQKLKEKLTTETFRPRVIKAEPDLSGDTIRVLIQLDPSQKEKINSLARELSLSKNVPDKFHVTLGYRYKDISDKNKKAVKKEFKLIINNLVNSYKEPIEFLEPKLCYFQDMLDFIPWDGKNNPLK